MDFLMTDADDTKESALSFYGDIVFKRKCYRNLDKRSLWTLKPKTCLENRGAIAEAFVGQ
jgi:hypothetical protein